MANPLATTSWRALASRQTSAVCRSSFHSSAICAGKKGMSKQGGGAKPGKQAASFKNKKMKKGEESKSTWKTDTGGIVKLDHPLFHGQRQVPILPEFDPTAFTSHVIGQAMAFPSLRNSAMNVFGLPSGMKQEIAHLGQPFSIVRQPTIDLLDKLDKAVTLPSDETRLVLTGETGSGKSILMLQAVNYCAANGWVVMYVPRAIDWMNSTSPYQYDYRSQTFHQYALAADMLKKMLEFNGAALKDIATTAELPLPGGRSGAVFPVGTKLETLAQHGIRDAAHAPQSLILLLEQLGHQKKYPVLLAVDDFHSLYDVSKYRDPNFNFIHGYNLSMPRIVLEYASGRRKFAAGALLGAISTTNTTFPVRLELKEALGLTDGGFLPGGYEKRAKVIQDFITPGLTTIQVPSGLTVDEASSLMEVWRDNNLVHSGLKDSFFLSKYMETGGNPRELVRRGVLSTLQA